MFTNVSYSHLAILIAYLAITAAALISIWRSAGDTSRKVIWTIVVLVLPVFGALLWAVNLAFGARHRSTPSGA